MILKPKDGLKIPKPGEHKFLLVSGEKIVLNTYWRRLLKSGDVVEVKPEAVQVKEPKKKTEKVGDEK